MKFDIKKVNKPRLIPSTNVSNSSGKKAQNIKFIIITKFIHKIIMKITVELL